MAKQSNYNSDYMSRKQDEQLEQMERSLSALYADASKQVQAEFDKFTSTFKKQQVEKQKQLEEGLITDSEYQVWVQKQILHTDMYTATINKLTDTMVKADKSAMAVVNGTLPKVVAESYNFTQALGWASAQKSGLSIGTFQVYNARSVQSLLKGSKIMKDVDVPADEKWNRDKINKAITTSLLKGDSISKTADALQAVENMDRNSAIRNARTCMTGAENLGRSEAVDDLKAKGIPVNFVWSCVHDARTRETHILLDGTVRDENGYFGADILNVPLRYPADPDGEPEEIYNCRCRASLELEGIDHSNDDELYKQFMQEHDPDSYEAFKDKDAEKEQAFQAHKERAEERLAEKQAEEAKNAQIEFMPAKTREEAEEYAKRFASNVDYKGLSLENANAVNETLTELTSKYPITPLDHIQQNAKGKYNACANGFGLTINGKRIGERNDPMGREATQNMINFYKSMYPNGRIPRDIQSKIDHLEEKLNFTRWSVSGSYDNSVRGTITHEYGHIIADQYFGQINDEKYKTRGEGDEWKSQKLEWRDIYGKAKDTKDIHKISEYGASDEHEFFAECFCAREKGEKLPSYIEDFMRKILHG